MKKTNYFLIKTRTLSDFEAERIHHVLLNDFFPQDLEIHKLDKDDAAVIVSHLNSKGVDFYEEVSK